MMMNGSLIGMIFELAKTVMKFLCIERLECNSPFWLILRIILIKKPFAARTTNPLPVRAIPVHYY